ncbi:WAT1-like protein [Thelohanellus kitauei]|uniref:WAT1-like protein n=1 Tax=Thelohanellus kitauei TaxID=669202 RepID=A0A0C2MNW2_THEKT|nr:WAT1-like protein [Thelohanellus kitauei]
MSESSPTLEILDPILEDEKVQIKKSKFESIKLYVFVGFLIVLSQVIFSGYGVVSVLYTKGLQIDIPLFIFFRALISALVTLLLAAIFEKGLIIPRPPFKLELCYFIIIGFMVNQLVPLIYLYAIVYTTASYCAIFSQLIPIFTAIYFYMFRIEKITSIRERWAIVQILGILIGCVFATIIVALQFHGFSKDKKVESLVIGTVLAILLNVIFALQFVCQTKLFYRNPNSEFKSRPLTTQAYSVTGGFLVYLVLVIPYFCLKRHIFDNIPIKILIPVLYASVLMCPVSFGLMAYCSKKVSPMIVGASFSLNVVLSFVMLRLFANEKLKIEQYILFIFVVIGVFMVLFAPILKPPAPKN